MGVIAGSTVDFTDYSAPGTPRILNVPDAVGDITIQDLWDTLSEEAAKLENLVYKKLLVRPGFGGKGVLSPTKSIGISMKTNNIQIKFEDLAGPSFTIKRVVDGNIIAQDHVGADLEPLASSDFVNWKSEADTSAAIVQPTLQQADLDAVADAVHSEDLSTYTTEGEAGDVARRLAFENSAVWVAQGSGNTGTDFPTGTPGKPVEDLTDAKAIADANGLKRFMIMAGNGFGHVMPAIDFNAYEFISQPPGTAFFNFGSAGRNYNLCSFTNMFLYGGTAITGGIKVFGGIQSAQIMEAANYYEADIASEIKSSPTPTSGFANIQFYRCSSRGAGGLDCNGIKTFGYLKQCAGQFVIKNCSNSESIIEVDLTGGQVTLDSSCTAGSITISGTCVVIDNSNGATVIDGTELSWMRRKLLTVSRFISLKSGLG